MDRLLIKNTLKEIIHLTPSRQAEVCYHVNISDLTSTQILVHIKPSLDHLTWARIGSKNRTMLYDSMIFHTGLAVGNMTAWLDQQDITYSLGYLLPDEPAVCCQNTRDAMWGNLDYLAHELSTWIELQRIHGHGAFANYQYDNAKCYRDLKFVLTAMCHDIKYLSNDHLISCLHEYFDMGGKLLVRQTVELEAYRFLRTLIVDKLLSNIPLVDHFQTHTCPSPYQYIAEAEGKAHVDYLFSVIIDVLSHGRSALPALKNSAPRTHDLVEIIVNV
jgi:hypothetical protein